MLKIITWVDLQGRYRVTSPAYDTLKKQHGFDEAEAIEWTWKKLVAQKLPNGESKYGILESHPHFLVEDADQRSRLDECCGTYFRWGAIARPNREGWCDKEGNILLGRDARDGAWEMDTDGRPKVNMTKARVVQMDYIRAARETEFNRLDKAQVIAIGRGDNVTRDALEAEKQVLRDIPQTFKLEGYKTPEELKAAWPIDLLP